MLGGYLGARIGLKRTMNIGLGLQVIALAMLAVPAQWLTIPLVMAAQALSGIAKDLNKMSAKSAIKQLVPDGQQGALFKWVAVLTGSKNALKGVGFFLGGILLAMMGFNAAVILMAAVLALIWIASLILLQQDLGKAKNKPGFNGLFSKNRAVPDGKSAFSWAIVLALVTAAIATALAAKLPPGVILIGGLIIFGIVFAINSSLHSYLIVSYARDDGVSLDVGFYYMANAVGRLTGTLLSGWIYQAAGLAACLWATSIFILFAAVLSLTLPKATSH